MSRLVWSSSHQAPSPSAAELAAQVASGHTPSATANGGRPLVGRTVADVERDLIIDTLSHCLGNRTNAANCSELVTTTFFPAGPLIVTNAGPALQSGDTFQLFSTGVSGFSSISLPPLTGTLYWITNLATSGNIVVGGGVSLTSPVLTNTITSPGTLQSPGLSKQQ